MDESSSSLSLFDTFLIDHFRAQTKATTAALPKLQKSQTSRSTSSPTSPSSLTSPRSSCPKKLASSPLWASSRTGPGVPGSLETWGSGSISTTPSLAARSASPWRPRSLAVRCVLSLSGKGSWLAGILSSLFLRWDKTLKHKTIGATMVDFVCPLRIVNFQPQLLNSWVLNRHLDFKIQQLSMSPCARSTLTHQLLEELNSTITILPKFPPKRLFQRSWGLELTIQSKLFCSFWVNKWFLRGNGKHFRNPGVTIYSLIPKCCPYSAIWIDWFWKFLVLNVQFIPCQPKSKQLSILVSRTRPQNEDGAIQMVSNYCDHSNCN